MKPVDFLAIGDPVVDEFIELQDASVHCDIDNENCTISMRWGDKIPFKSAVLIAGVGNSANAAVSAARLGLSSALLGIVGKDRYGEEIFEVYKNEGLDRDYLSMQEGVPTNHHYVLSYESERTILVKHEAYQYEFPKDLPAPKTLYISSLGESVGDEYYSAIADFADAHKDMFVAFQPGTFQMKIGIERLKRIYKRSNIFFCNKEEAARILKREDLDILGRMKGLMELGPKIVVVTDGRNGAYAYDGTNAYRIPMYPDPRKPVERTGAGDAFSSTTTVALTLGKPLSEALLWGPINAMCVVQDIGAQRGLLSKDALEKYLGDAPKEYATSPL
jgi:sugar/nucleoside kinase (ribokinase family)